MRHEPASVAQKAVRQWLVEHHAGRGRVFVSDWTLAEFLAAGTRIPILGGLLERNVPHVDANLFRRSPDDLKGDALKRYFELYAVGWVVVEGDHGLLDYRPDLLAPAQALHGYRVYRTRSEPSYFLRGEGNVQSQSLNSIVVTGARGSDLVLRFHWMETLRCRPGCDLEREMVGGDRVGFIRIPAPPQSFEIFNAY
jgi:hypothetical protein